MLLLPKPLGKKLNNRERFKTGGGGIRKTRGQAKT